VEEPMKHVELKLIAELMKNSRRSDRELAKVVGISQPTVSRLRSKLEREGVIREYTAIPDFTKLGYNLMAITLMQLKPLSNEEIDELQKASHELNDQTHRPFLLVMDGMGIGKQIVSIAFFKTYTEYETYARDIKNAASSRMKAYMNLESIDSFLVDLNYKKHYQSLTLARIVENFSTLKHE
jgi:DNA-binding Lrp family transcriptional regulator